MMRYLLLALACILSTGCSYLIEQQSNKMAEQMSDTMLNFEDPATVGAAMPTFLIIIDSIARNDDAGAASKLAAAKIYGAYTGAFVHDPERQQILSNKAFSYARQGACKTAEHWCNIERLKSADFRVFAEQLNADDVAISYAYAVAWLGYIQANASDWNAVANLSKAKLLLQQVIRYDETYDNAGAHLYLAAIETLLPPALGGKPEIARAHFEKAIALTHGHNLLVKVEYARRYARMMFEQELHHQLLTEVTESDAEYPGLTLMNSWAQMEARKLLADEAEYFE